VLELCVELLELCVELLELCVGLLEQCVELLELCVGLFLSSFKGGLCFVLDLLRGVLYLAHNMTLLQNLYDSFWDMYHGNKCFSRHNANWSTLLTAQAFSASGHL
jgi:hypothetical protein